MNRGGLGSPPIWLVGVAALVLALLVWQRTRSEAPPPYSIAVVDRQVRQLKVAGRYADAEVLLRREIAAASERGASNSQLGVLRTLRGDVLTFLGRYDEARSVLDHAVRDLERSGGIHLGVALHDLAAVRHEQGAYTEAESLFRRALAVKESVSPPDEPSVAETLDNLGSTLSQEGRASEAEPLQRRAVALFRRAPDREDDLAIALANLGHTLMALGWYEEAETDLREALALQRRIHPADHPATAATMQTLAVCLSETNRVAEALAMQREVVAMDERTLPPDHPDLVLARQNLAAVSDMAARGNAP